MQNIARIYLRKLEIEKAIHYADKAYNINKETKDKLWMISYYKLLGEIKSFQGDLDAAINYFNMSVELIKTDE